MAAAILLCSCSAAEEAAGPGPQVLVTLVDGDGYTAEESQVKVARGGEASFRLHMDADKHAVSCSYEDCRITEEDSFTTLELFNVMYPVRVEIETGDAPLRTITYNLNGGQFVDGDFSAWDAEYIKVLDADTYTASTFQTHKRINTSTAYGIIYRYGYTQTGWNTKADLSGEHVGLGSRITYENGLTLYAEWAPWTPASEFFYVSDQIGNGIVLMSYAESAGASGLVIPGEINGYTVDKIAAGFAEGLKAEYLILPPTIEEIKKEAFAGGEIDNVYFSDTLESVYDESFDGCTVHSVHLNAVRPPAHLAANPNARFAENMDNLMMYEGKPRLVFFAGCSMSYGLKSEVMQEAFPQYQVLDLGVIGGINGYFQMQIISRFLRDGDVFVHAPEGISPYQLMISVDTDSRIFTMVEGNYDLMSYADVADMELFWSSYATFTSNREKLDPLTYEAVLDMYNDYGDITYERPYDDKVSNVSFDSYRYAYLADEMTEEAFGRLSGMYGEYAEKGVRVLFSFSPFNEAALSVDDKRAGALSLEEYFKARQKEGGYEVISDMENYLYPAKYFYDTDYHLNDVGALVRTRQLIEDLSAVL